MFEAFFGIFGHFLAFFGIFGHFWREIGERSAVDLSSGRFSNKQARSNNKGTLTVTARPPLPVAGAGAYPTTVHNPAHFQPPLVRKYRLGKRASMSADEGRGRLVSGAGLVNDARGLHSV